MKKFNFKLKGLLKVKEFNEKLRKIELGDIVKDITDVRSHIVKIKEQIKEAKEAEQALIDSAVSAELIQFYPRFIEVQNMHLKNLHCQLDDLQKMYNAKVVELGKARGEVKIFDKLKEKEYSKFKKRIERREMQDLEEQINIRRILKGESV
jgi:flagellar FliJ protein